MVFGFQITPHRISLQIEKERINSLFHCRGPNSDTTGKQTGAKIGDIAFSLFWYF